MDKNREQYIRHAASWMVERINADALTVADCSVTEIARAIEGRAPFFERLIVSTQYNPHEKSAGALTSLAKAIAGRVANHPDRKR